MKTVVGRLQALVEPTAALTDPLRRQNASLLAALCLLFIFLSIVTPISNALLAEDPGAVVAMYFPIVVPTVVLLIACYAGARHGHEGFSVRVMIGILTTVIFFAAAPGVALERSNLLLYLIMPMMLAAVFLEFREALVLHLSIGLAILLMGVLLGTEVARYLLLGPGSAILIAGLMMLMAGEYIRRQQGMQRRLVTESEKLMQVIAANAGGDVAMFEAETGRFRYLSPSVQVLAGEMGISAPESIFETWWSSRFHPDDYSAILQAAQLAVQTGATQYCEYRFQRVFGTWIWYEVSLTPTQNAGRLCIVAINRDIDARKQIELLIARERVLLRDILDALPDQIYIKDIHFRIIMSNAAHNRSFGWDETQMIGKTAAELYPPEVAERLHTLDEQVIASRQPIVDYEFVLDQPAGEQRFWISKVPLLNDQGAVDKILCCLRNVTEKVRLQEAQREGERLRLALDQERKLNQLQNTFMITVSHEFRTPLATILSSSELLETYGERLNPERRRECLVSVRRQVLHLSRMLDEIRMLLALQNQQNALHIEPVDLSDFLHGLIDDLGEHHGRQHPVRLTISPALETIHSDRLLLRHILGNLITNALQYAPAGTPVEIDAALLDDALRFTVADHGPGIPESERATIFRPFVRGTGSSEAPGTGLGLAIVQHSVKLFGGQVMLEQVEGGGARFVVLLPPFAPGDAPEMITDSAVLQSAAE